MTSSEHIAIVGTAGRFPAARSVRRFWQMLAEGRTSTRWLSEQELLAAGVSAAELADPNYVRAANILPDMQSFDAGFFGFSPREASILDPQHRHFLECAWELFEDAGHVPEKFDGRIGVFAGSGMQAYLPFNLLTNPELVAQVGLFLLRHTGNDKDFMPTRLSYLLNLKGPSMAVQTACSTSLVAVHQASASLLSGECDMALAGGVTIELPHGHGYRFAEGEILSPDGICRAFDDESKGTIFGSGVALVMLRRLDDALADGDDIRAVLIGSAVNNDGAQKAGYLAPSVDGQAEAAAEALALAGVEPGEISYLEAHGTGTAVGDPIELSALSQVYGAGGRQYCGIGSVKTNIGHLDTAAGTASLIKVIEALRHEAIPPTLNYSKPNSRFDIAASPFVVADKLRPWPRTAAPRRAAVNSLGVGGTNAHVIVQEAPVRAASVAGNGWRIFPFSARGEASLDGMAASWREMLADPAPGFSAADAAFTLQNGRRDFSKRRAYVARDSGGLAELLASGDKRRIAGGTAAKDAPEVVFMFPGGGAQFPGAGRDLLETVPAFAEAVAECFAVLPPEVPADLREIMFERDVTDAEASARLERPIYALPALFVLEIAYARMWQAWGVQPAALIGHSAGEYAGAVLAGILSLGDAAKIVTWRGLLMEDLPAGAMAAIPASEAKVRELIGEGLDIAAVNAPELCVASGPEDRIEALVAQLAGTEMEARRLRINVAAHSRMLDGALDGFRAKLETIRFGKGNLRFVSTLRGGWGAEDDFASAGYWTRHLRGTVRFGAAMEAVLARPNTILLEIGPGNSLGSLAQMSAAPAKPVAVAASTRQPKEADDDLAFALTSAARLWCAGATLDWAALPGAGGRRISLPAYAFERQVHWVHPGKPAAVTAAASDVLTRRGKVAEWFETKVWREQALPPSEARHGEDWLVFGGDDALSGAVGAALAARGAKMRLVRAGSDWAESSEAVTLRADAAEDYLRLLASGVPGQILWLWRADGDEAFHAPFLLMRALQTADIAGACRVTFVAAGGASVAGEKLANFDAALMLGLVRVAPRETPGLAAQMADIDPSMPPETTAALLLAECDGDSSDDRVAWRGGKRFVESLSRLDAAASPKARLKNGGHYLISGGTGGIGRELARWLASEWQAKVTLLARHPLPPEGEQAAIRREQPQSRDAALLALVEQAQKAGGDVQVLAADVTDREALGAVLSGIGKIDGVFHAAGTINDAPMALKDPADAAAVLAPKVAGGRNLAALLPEGSVDFFAVFSSSSVVIAPPGQSDYVAANAWLEALAASRADGLAIAWGAWGDTGMAAEAYGMAMGAAGPHPLLGPLLRDEQGVVSFQKWFVPGNLWVLHDHVVGGVKVLPGTAYLEIALAAGRAAEPRGSFEIEALSLALPLAFPGDVPRLVRVRLLPGESGFDLRVESAVERGGPFTEHCRARLVRRDLSGTKVPKGLLAKPELRRSERSGHALQEGLIEFGPRWHSVGDIRVDGSLAEADFALPPEFSGDLAEYPAHPGLTDMAVTIGLHLLPELMGTPKAIYAPVSFDRVRLLAPLTARLKGRAVLVLHEAERLAKFDVLLSGEGGKPLMVLEGLSMRYVDKEKLAVSADAPQSLTTRMLAQGIRASEADEVFALALAAPAANMIVSPVSPAMLRLEFARAQAPAARAPRERKAAAEGTGGFANKVEAAIAGYWEELLGIDGVKPDDDFFDNGGHSLSAVRLFAKIRHEFGVDLPLAALFEAATVRGLSQRVISEGGIDVSEDAPAESAPQPKSWSPLVQIKKGAEDLPALFCVHGAGGNVLNFRSLAGYLHPNQRFYGLQAQGVDGVLPPLDTIEDMAAIYLAAIRAAQPQGPYYLAGYSGGGVVAYEIAQRLLAAGESVGSVVMFDSLAPHVTQTKATRLEKLWAVRHWSLAFAMDWPRRRRKNREDRQRSREIREFLQRGERVPAELMGRRMTDAYRLAQSRYQPQPFGGEITLFTAGQAGTEFLRAGRKLGWDKVVTGSIEVHRFDCDHFNMMADPTIGVIAERLNEMLRGR